VADPSRLNFSSPDRRLSSSGSPIACGRSLITGGWAIPRPRVALQLRPLISGESCACEVATLAGDPPDRESPRFHRRSTHTPSAPGTLTATVLWLPVTDVSVPDKEEAVLFGAARLSSKRPTRNVGTQSRTSSEWMPEAYISECATTLLENAAACQNVWGFTWRCSDDIDPAMKGFLSLEYRRGVLHQQNRVKPLGTTLSTLAEMAEESAGCDFSLRSAADSRQRAFQKKGDVADWSIAKQYMDHSRGVQPGNRAGEPCRGQSLSQKQGVEELMEAAVR
jgi:hypothetical protein